MNPKPVSYLQTDARWKNTPYAVKGESSTIGGSGCGPTAMAMVLATWADKSVTPKTECAWALAHGYKALRQGTYYGYFAPAAKRYNLICTMLNGASIYGNANSTHHTTAKNAILNGDLVIACMGKGTWTRSGHYVLVWWIDGNTVYINDPASTNKVRTQGNYSIFKTQVKHYWVIKRPTWLKKGDEVDMTKEEVRDLIKSEVASQLGLVQDAQAKKDRAAEPDWSKKEGHWQRATEKKITDGKEPERAAKRDEVIAWLGRLGLL